MQGDRPLADGQLGDGRLDDLLDVPYGRILRLRFRPDPAPDFAILKAGEAIQADAVLRTDADYV